MSENINKPDENLASINHGSKLYSVRMPNSQTNMEKRSSLLSDNYKENSQQIFSDETKVIMNRISELESKSGSAFVKNKIVSDTLDERLFDARANVKILLSKVSMHYSDVFREKLYRQIDLIHDPDDWEDEEVPVMLDSFKTFLRWFYLTNPSTLPNFGLTDSGNFIATWVENTRNTLIMEYLASDRVKWYLAIDYEDNKDLTSGTTNIERSSIFLKSLNVDKLFFYT